MTARTARHHDLLLFLAATALFTLALPAREFIGFETRFALFVQEMLRTGWTLFPHTHMGPYPDYPGTSTWILYYLSRLLGGLSLPVAVIPSALLSAWTVVMTWRIGALEDQRWAWAGVLALIGTEAFFQQARTLSIDPYVMALLATSMWILLRADHENRPLPVLGLLLLQLAALAVRGPIGLVMVTGVNTLYLFATGRWRQGFFVGLRALGALLAGTGLLLLAAWIEGGEPFVREVLRMEVVGRFEESRDPLGTYWIDSFGNYFYGYLLAVPVVLLAIFRRPGLTPQGRRLLLALVVWMLVILVGMSVPATKKARYILPMAPAVALLAAFPVLALKEGRAWSLLWRGTSFLLRTLPLLFLAILPFLPPLLARRGIDLTLNLWSLAGVLLLLTWLAWRGKGEMGEPLRHFLIATAVVVAIHVLLLEPFNWKKQTSAHFVHQVETLRTREQAELGFFCIGADGAAVVYLVNADTGNRPRFFTSRPDPRQLSRPLLLVMKSREARRHFSDQIPVVEGVMDGVEMSVIRLSPTSGATSSQRNQ